MEITWSSIPPDILFLIAGKIISGDDYVSFSAVCRTWYVIANDFYTNFNHKLNLRPFYVPGTDPGSKRITLQNLASGTTFPVDLPETAGTSRCWGSPFGWLIAFDHTDRRLTLFNPFTGAAIPLSSLPNLNHSEVYLVNPFTGVNISLDSLPSNRSKSSQKYNDRRCKAFMTANPDSNPDDCLVAFSLPGKLAVFRPKFKSWSPFSGRVNELEELHNVVYHKGNLYGIQSSPYLRVKLFVFELPQTLTLSGRYRPVQFIILNLNPVPILVRRSGKPEARHERCIRITKAHKQLDVVNGELCLCALYYTWDASSLATTYSLVKINLFSGHLIGLEPLGLRFGEAYSFPCDTSYTLASPNPAEDYELYIYECLHDYVTYNGPGLVSSSRAFDVEVWNLLHYLKDEYDDDDDDDPTSSSRPFWILPSIKFPKLEDGAIES